jgi:hypothetical protein
LAFAGFPLKASGVRTAVGGFCTGGGFPPVGGGGACWVGTCTGAKEGGMELICTGGVDKSAALNEGPVISPIDGCLCFPFPVVIGKEPGSADAGLVCPKTEPVCRVRGRLGRPRDSFCVAATMVRSVVSNNSST